MASRDWETTVKNLIKGELKHRGMTYAQLAERLQAIGVDEHEGTIKKKLSRGRFTAVFFVQCLTAIGSDRLRL